MIGKSTNHTFVVCAYGESQYLEDCIRSVVSQTVGSNVIMTTSTPNGHIAGLAEKYKMPLYVNKKFKQGAIEDWNYGYACAGTDLVTLCHQDDIYCENYAEMMLKKCNGKGDMLIFFSDYCELRGGEKVYSNKLLNVKKLLLSPLRIKVFARSRFVRRRILSFGSPICCPAVTFYRPNLPEEIFRQDFQCLTDWSAWERISRLDGSFLYCAKPLMCHRIHAESWTTQVIENSQRYMEEGKMFEAFWPPFMAGVISRLYRQGGRSNKVDGEG